MNVKKILATVTAFGVFAVAGVASAATATSTAETINEGFLADITGIIYDFLPQVLGLLAVLVGVGWGVSRLKKHSGGKKV